MLYADEEEYVNLSRAAELLAVSKITLHRWIKRGVLTAYSLGPRRLLIKRADLNGLLRPVLREPSAVWEVTGGGRRVAGPDPNPKQAARAAPPTPAPWPELDDLTRAVSRLWAGPGAVEEVRLQRGRPE